MEWKMFSHIFKASTTLELTLSPTEGGLEWRRKRVREFLAARNEMATVINIHETVCHAQVMPKWYLRQYHLPWLKGKPLSQLIEAIYNVCAGGLVLLYLSYTYLKMEFEGKLTQFCLIIKIKLTHSCLNMLIRRKFPLTQRTINCDIILNSIIVSQW